MSGYFENVDGHRVWVPSNVPSSEVSTASTPSLISTSEDGVLPPFDVYAGFVMRPDTIALHFPLTAVPALAELFPTEAEKIRAAALDVEQEAEWQQDVLTARRRLGVG